jgi:predicted nucleic acid-binding protein
MTVRLSLDRAFMDTNILVYVYDPEAPAKRDRARALVIDHLGNGTLALSTQVLLEFYWTVTRKPEVPIPHAVAAGLAGQLLTAHVVAPSAELALAAIERSGRDSLPIWDAFILEAAESCGAATLYTEDRHLAGVPTALSVVDPFADLPRPDAD